MMELLHDQVSMTLQIIVGAAVSALCAYATIYVKKAIALGKVRANKIKNEEARNIVKSTLDKVDVLISTNIVSAENTLKPAIVQAISDGEVDKSELDSLAIVVKKKVIDQLSKESLEVFNSSLNNSNSYLENRIEKILAELKDTEGTGVSKTVIIAPNNTESVSEQNNEVSADNDVQEINVTSVTTINTPGECSKNSPQ